MLEIRNVSAFYGRVEALRALDMDVLQGSITAIIGANGAGKSTLLRAVSGLIPTRYGTISYYGTDITGTRPDRIVGLGISHVPEGRQVFGPLSVLDNLKLGAFRRMSLRRPSGLEDDLA
ncbi:MAG: ATP-binding cassette domain-containing protein, partial [Candidatus Geothermincolia bacterium]